MITLKDIAEKTGGVLKGDGNVIIRRIMSMHEAQEGDITFLSQKGFEKYLKDTRASAVIVGNDVKADEYAEKNLIIVKNPGIAYAKVAQMFHKGYPKGMGISSLACISKSAEISDTASIYPYVFVGEGSKICKDVVLYPFVHIGEHVLIEDGTILYPHVTVYDDVKIGKNVIIHSGAVLGSDGFGYVWDGSKHMKIPQLGTVEIGDDVEIGANTSIDRASLGKTIIKKGTKIDNLVQIAHNVSIGENSIVVSLVGIAGSTSVGDNVVLAGRVGVKDHVRIGNNVRAAGGTGITKDVPDNSLISGTPHMPHKEWLKLQGYLKNLSKMYERIKKIEKTLKTEAQDD
ncbi:MAG TPA: UDP-3-O-(3-hydroxymyristoyl)glucosamine N-acyltransferase [Syntrophorhabdaceae bacterium]|nr:UDP-3-O-(3-hydroxymyristoyl)glucosamine N-acyltransferase [Syntrophorhabdaceae bacterium]HOS04924.1 UDP-3-O-(3-hydroxymyristoyl)glucosamine N-acyltransferase [Syntrophorhabdaceae bacterium]HPL40250.1 UDP-3-O-(3-hydroxymyristoyl)glucosamine N-acyltransferase [Syntrophorhabdaceae bacterium]